MISSKRRPIIITLTVCIIVILVYAFSFYGRIATSSDSKLLVNGQLFDSPAKLRPGKYNVSIVTPLKKNSEQKITVSPYSTKHIVNNNQVYGVKDIMNLAAFDLPGNFYVHDYKFFDNNTWLVANIYNSDEASKAGGLTAILKFTYSNGWRVYNTGTGLADDNLKNTNPEVYDYIVGGSRE